MTLISIIIPTLNEAQALPVTVQLLQPLKEQGVEIIVVDGGSVDKTLNIAEQYATKTVQLKVGRARQMNAGAECAEGELLLFLHADTQLPSNALTLLDKLSGKQLYWGRFNVKLDGASYAFRIIENMMNWRSRLTGIVTGDHAMFISKDLFTEVKGFPDIALMEDIAISKKLKKVSMPVCLKESVITSSRRWNEYGVIRTVLLMWRLRWAFFWNEDAQILAERYQHIRAK